MMPKPVPARLAEDQAKVLISLEPCLPAKPVHISNQLNVRNMRQHRTIGAVHAVPLGDETNGYAIALPEADFAFFDARFSTHPGLDEILTRQVLFRVAVHKSAWTSGRWQKIGKVAVPPELLMPRPTFIQDSLKPERYEIYLAGEIRPATRAECEGLERCAVWEPNHVEDRLRDHYAGRPNKWVESLRLK